MRVIVSLMCLVMVMLACKKKETDTSNIVNDADRAFAVKASKYDSAEIIAAKLALTKTDTTLVDTLVQIFAGNVLIQHRQSLSDLRVMGGLVGFDVPEQIDTAALNRIVYLNTFNGKDFDSIYLVSMLQGQSGVASFYIDEVDKGNQRNVKNYASATLEKVRAQYVRADSIRGAFFH